MTEMEMWADSSRLTHVVYWVPCDWTAEKYSAVANAAFAYKVNKEWLLDSVHERKVLEGTFLCVLALSFVKDPRV